MPWLVLPPLALATLVYLPITRNYFFSDDFLHLYEVANGQAASFVLSPTAGHLLLLRNLIFYLCIRLFGPEPAGFFWLVLVTHLANVALLFVVIRRACASDRLASVGAAAWGMSPFNEGTLGWYSVYGQVLATTLILLMLADCLRQPERPPTAARVLVWCGLMLLAANCFGTAIGVAIALPVLVALLRPDAWQRPATALPLALFPVFIVVTYVVQHTLNPHVAPEGGINTGTVTFALALAWRGGWWPFAGMALNLLMVGIASLCLSFAFVPASYPSPASVGLAVVVAIGMVVTLARAPGTTRRRVLAFLLVALACYGTIALGRGAYLWNYGGLVRAAVVPRYHYPSIAFLAAALCTVAAAIPRRLVPGPSVANLALGGALAGMLILFLWSGFRIDHHDAERQEVAALFATLQQRVATAPPHAPILVENRHFRPIGPLTPQRTFPGQAAVFIAFSPTNDLAGHPIRFVTRNPNALLAAQEGTRAPDVLVAPPAAPSPP